MADAPGLLDPVGLSVILDVPVGTVDGWRFTGRGPRWSRMGGVVRYRTDDVRAYLWQAQTEARLRVRSGGASPRCRGCCVDRALLQHPSALGQASVSVAALLSWAGLSVQTDE
jgi:hypothetical protein